LCHNFWRLRDDAFLRGNPFDKKLALNEEGVDLPADLKVGPHSLGLYSASGALDDSTPPHSYNYSTHIFMSAADFGFAARGHRVVVLGGGNLEFCLHKAFESLVRIKTGQNDHLQVAMPLPLTYASDKVDDSYRYMLGPNKYYAFLREQFESGKIPGFALTLDGEEVPNGYMGTPSIQLHVFSSLRSFFGSMFFPEVCTDDVLRRIIAKVEATS
jgi:hypothetical protein